MTIVRWESARDLGSLQREVDRVFSSVLEPSASRASAARWIPPIDLEELEDSYLLSVDLPGVSEDDVAIDVEDDVLTLSGARGRVRTTDEARAVRIERGHGSFRRRLTLPEGVDPERIVASFDRGVLEVRVPKPEQARPRRVSIQVGRAPRTIEDGAAAPPADGPSTAAGTSPPDEPRTHEPAADAPRTDEAARA